MRWLVVVCVAAASIGVRAQSGVNLAGAVWHDRTGLAVRSGFAPAANVTVTLYRDGGDGQPTADDARLGTTTTDAAGVYVFRVTPGSYWVAVDSRTLGSSEVWAEQTFGPAGALCAQPNGTSRTTWFEGSCVGGRSFASDNPTSLATSEHVALVNVRDAATRVDFAFSFNVVTNTRDGERIQGSLRQFVVNANATAGGDPMRFIPLEPARQQADVTSGVPPKWWTITLATPLPELRDEDTLLDGTAYNFLSPASPNDVHPGRIGEPPTMKPDERIVPRTEKPELELVLNGTSGIVCASECGIRGMALHGVANAIVTRADARIEHVLIGALPDGTPTRLGTTGLQVEKGTVYARHVVVTLQSQGGIVVGRGARLDAERLDVSRCGEPAAGGGVLLFSDGSSIRSSVIAANAGAGIIVGAPDGTAPASANTIDGCTISSNLAGVILGPNSSRNTITRNDIMWNRLGGVTSAPFQTAAAPRENRLSANRFNENGLRPIVLNLDVEDPNQLARGATDCTRATNAANAGITVPQISEVRVQQEGVATRVVIRGRACPGEIVELYQSFVTSGVRDEQQAELPDIRNERVEARETLTNEEREMALPSIGEFNYLGATNTRADGTFEAMFPLPAVVATTDTTRDDEETNIWASQVLPSSNASERAFSAIAIDAQGNTSEMSVRRQVD